MQPTQVAGEAVIGRDAIDSTRNAVVDAATVCSGLWFSYILAMTYVAVAVGGVTDRDLLLAKPSTLPFVGAEVPLEGFGWIVPALFLIAHVYVLLHFVLLSLKVQSLNLQLRQSDLSPAVVERLRGQLPINIFVQFLAGPHETRQGVLGFLLRAIAWITLVFAPVALLALVELRFLPYQATGMSLWERTAVLIDVGLLWTLWPRIVGRRVGAPFRSMKWQTTGSLLLTTALFGTTCFLMPFYVRGNLAIGHTSLVPTVSLLPRGDLFSLSYVMSSRLNLTRVALADKSVSLKGRKLEDALLSDAALPKVDFSYADLKGAQLYRSVLLGADFTNSHLEGANLDNAQLRGAILDGANLEGASLYGAQLQGATLQGACLNGANLRDANLQGADLNGADLTGAVFDGAKLQGAILDRGAAFGDVTACADRETTFSEASLLDVSTWRAIITPATDFKKARVRFNNAPNGIDLAELKQFLERDLPESDSKTERLEGILKRLDPATSEEGADIETAWRKIGARAFDSGSFDQDIVHRWAEIGCASEGSPFVLEGLAHSVVSRTSPLAADGDGVKTLVKTFLGNDCLGAANLPAEIKASLGHIGDH